MPENARVYHSDELEKTIFGCGKLVLKSSKTSEESVELNRVKFYIPGNRVKSFVQKKHFLISTIDSAFYENLKKEKIRNKALLIVLTLE